MPTPASPARLRILQLLADNDWHLVEEVIVTSMRAVPPGQAWRHGEAMRHRRNPDGRVRGDDATAISTGARQIITRTLHDMYSGRPGRRIVIERDGDYIRLAPSTSDTLATPTPLESAT